MAEHPSGSFKVELLGPANLELSLAVARAKQLGIKNAFYALIREVYQHLVTHPVSWGDQTQTYHAAGLREYHRLHKKLSIRYAVDVSNHVVYIKQIRPVMDHPLASG
jgi:hypothetical protein